LSIFLCYTLAYIIIQINELSITGYFDLNLAGGKTLCRKKLKKFDEKTHYVSKPAYEVIPDVEVKGRQGAMTLMSNNLVPDSNFYIETGWVFGMPDPNPHIHEHVHDYDKIVIHLGTNPKNQEDLGGEIEFMVDGQPLIINKTSAVYVPKGVKHGPLTWKKYSRPHLEFTIMIGAGSLAEADPGGHEKKKAGEEKNG